MFPTSVANNVHNILKIIFHTYLTEVDFFENEFFKQDIMYFLTHKKFECNTVKIYQNMPTLTTLK